MKKKNKKIKNKNKKRKTLEILEYGLWLLPLSLAPDGSDDDGRGERGRLPSASLGEDANVINDVVVNHPARPQAQTEIGHLV